MESDQGEVAEILEALNCPGSHGLAPPPNQRQYTCDVCKLRGLSRSQESLYCTACDFDVCPACIRTFQESEVQIVLKTVPATSQETTPEVPVSSTTWTCPVCTFINPKLRWDCEMCGGYQPSANGGPQTGAGEQDSAEQGRIEPWACKACTIINEPHSYICSMCGTENDELKALLGTKASSELTPTLLLKLAEGKHFSLQEKLVELSHEMALAVAMHEEGPGFRHTLLAQNLELSGFLSGISRHFNQCEVNMDYLVPLMTIMSESSQHSHEVAMLACRTLNCFLRLDPSCIKGVKAGKDQEEALDIYIICLTEMTYENQSSAWELAAEAVVGVDLICRASATHLRQLYLLGGLETVIKCLVNFEERNYAENFLVSGLQLLAALIDVAVTKHGDLKDFVEETLQVIYQLFRMPGYIEAKTVAVALMKGKFMVRFSYHQGVEGLLTEQYQDILVVLLADSGQPSADSVDLVAQLLGLVRPTTISLALEQGVLLRTALQALVDAVSLTHSLALIKMIGLLAHLLTHKVLPYGYVSASATTAFNKGSSRVRQGAKVQIKGWGDKTATVVAEMGYGTIMLDWKDGAGLEEVASTEVDASADQPLSAGGLSPWFRLTSTRRAQVGEESHRLFREDLQPGRQLLNRFLKQFISSGNVSMVQKVLKDGADPNSNIFKDRTPLAAAAESDPGVSGALITVLVAAGAEVNALMQGENKGSALHFAARANNRAAVVALLESGALPHLADAQGLAPFQCTEDSELRTLLQPSTSTEETSEVVSPLIVEVSDHARNQGLKEILNTLLKHFPSAPACLVTIWLALIARVYSAIQSECLETEEHSLILHVLEKMLFEKSKDIGTLVCVLKLLLDAVHRFPNVYISALHRNGAISVLESIEKQYGENAKSRTHTEVSGWTENSSILSECVMARRGAELVLLARGVLEQCRVTSNPSMAASLSLHAALLSDLTKRLTNFQHDIDSGTDALLELGNALIADKGITSYEFQAAGLGHALENFLKTAGGDGWATLVQAMMLATRIDAQGQEISEPRGSEVALTRLIQLVQSALDLGEFTASPMGMPTELYEREGKRHLGSEDSSGSASSSLGAARMSFATLLRPLTLELTVSSEDTNCQFKDSKRGVILMKIQPLTRMGQLEETLFQSLIITHPTYIKYCQSLIGGTVHLRQRLDWSSPLQVVGFDSVTNLHLLKSPESNDFEQVNLATKKYRAALSEGGQSILNNLISLGADNLATPVGKSVAGNLQVTIPAYETGQDQEARLEKFGIAIPSKGSPKTKTKGLFGESLKEHARIFPASGEDGEISEDVALLTQPKKMNFLAPNFKKSVKSFLPISPRDKEKILTPQPDKGGTTPQRDASILQRFNLSTKKPNTADVPVPKPSWQKNLGNVMNLFKDKASPMRSPSPRDQLLGTPIGDNSTGDDNKIFAIGDKIEAQFQLPDGEWTTAWYGGSIRMAQSGQYSIIFDDGDFQSAIPAQRVRKPVGLQVPGSIVQVLWPQEGGLPLSATIIRIHPDGSCDVIYEDGDHEDRVAQSRIIGVISSKGSVSRGTSVPQDNHRRAWVKVEGAEVWLACDCEEAASVTGMDGAYKCTDSNGNVVQSSETEMLNIEESSRNKSRMMGIADRLFRRRGSMERKSSFRQNMQEEMKSHLDQLRNRLTLNKGSGSDTNESNNSAESYELRHTLSALLSGSGDKTPPTNEDAEAEADEAQETWQSTNDEMLSRDISDDDSHEPSWAMPPTMRIAIALCEEPHFATRSGGLFSVLQSSPAPNTESQAQPQWSLFDEEDSLVKCIAALKACQSKGVGDNTSGRGQTMQKQTTGLQFKVVMEGDSIFTSSRSGGQASWAAFLGSLPEEQQYALHLLHLMWSYRAADKEMAASFNQRSNDLSLELNSHSMSVWSNFKLCEALAVLLADGIAVASGAVPAWVDGLVCRFPFLVGPLTLRWRYFQATALGVSRSLLALQQAPRQDHSPSHTTPSRSENQLFNQLQKEVVHVSKDHILRDAEKIMKMYSRKKVALEFRFIGEKGMGAGVTASFYSALAEKLIERETNNRWKLWVDEDSAKRNVGVLSHPNGLFPCPLPMNYPNRQEVLAKFRFMGRLIGRTFLDRQIVPLPFSVDFMDLVVGRGLNSVGKLKINLESASCLAVELEEMDLWCSASALPRIFLGPGKCLMDLFAAIIRLKDIQKNTDKDDSVKAFLSSKVFVGRSGLPVEEWLELAGLNMTDPISGYQLVPNGEAIGITLDNVELYTRSLMNLWLGEGIRDQVLEFQHGVNEVLPVHKLRLFFGKELAVLVGGEQSFDWNVPFLERHVVPSHGYTSSSSSYRLLLEVMSEMTVTEKKQFLLFVTGCPHLPPGGLASLSPPLEVLRRQPPAGMSELESQAGTYDLPFARTCTNTLHLPPYASKEMVIEKLQFVILNSSSIIDRD